MARLTTLADWEALTGPAALTGAERALIHACREGQTCQLGNGECPQGPSPERAIRADLLRYLILGGWKDCQVAERGVDLEGACISGDLDLDFAQARGGTRLVFCRFEEPITAMQARFELLNLSGSHLPGLNAQGARVTGNVFLNEGFTAKGAVRLAGARIEGQLGCEGGRFENPGGHALNAQGAQVTESIFLSEGFTAQGEVRLAGARIGGQLSCIGGKFENAGGYALNAQGAQVTESIFLSEGFTAQGEVRLAGARIGGQLSCIGGKFENAGGYALNAEGAQVTDDVFLSKGFTAKGEVSLAGARIGGQLACMGGKFENAGGDALNAQSTQVMGDVFLNEGFTAKGEVKLLGARIGGQLSCIGGKFENAGGWALNAQRMRVEGSFLWLGVTVEEGRIYLAAAHVGDLVDNEESWPGGGRLFLDGFTYDRLSATFTDARRRLDWLQKGTRWKYDDGRVDFFPQPYTQLARVLRAMGHDRDARQVMMAREEQLAAEQLRADEARLEELRKGTAEDHGDIGWHWLQMQLFRLWNTAIRALVGYGYAPQRAFYWAAGTLTVMTLFYFVVWNAGGMVPASPVVLVSADWAAAMNEDPSATGRVWAETAPTAAHYATFLSGFHAADVFIPLVDFGQEAAWTPTTKTVPGMIAFGLNFAFKAFGWFITALGAAAIAGIIRRE